MARTLENLITEASAVFSDGFMLIQYHRGPAHTRPVELLAQYLVTELHDLYDPAGSDQENLDRMITNLDMSSAKIGEVSQYLQDLRKGRLT